jgi:hypothetical protein
VRIRAAEENLSISALVRRLLMEPGAVETDYERRRRLQDTVLTSIQAFRAADRLSRDQVHDREVR